MENGDQEALEPDGDVEKVDDVVDELEADGETDASIENVDGQ